MLEGKMNNWFLNDKEIIIIWMNDKEVIIEWMIKHWYSND